MCLRGVLHGAVMQAHERGGRNARRAGTYPASSGIGRIGLSAIRAGTTCASGGTEPIVRRVGLEQSDVFARVPTRSRWRL